MADELLTDADIIRRAQEARRPGGPLEGVPIPAWMPGQTPLPGSAMPPPGFLASTPPAPTPDNTIAPPSPPPIPSSIPGGERLPNGMTAGPAMGIADRSSPLGALRDQMSVINQINGPAPQQPMVRDQMEEGPIQIHGSRMGLQGLYSGPTRIVANQGDLANMQAYNTALNGRSQDVGQLLGRLGTMGDQNIRFEHLTAPGGLLDQGRSGIANGKLGDVAFYRFITDPANGSTVRSRVERWTGSNLPVPGNYQEGGATPNVPLPGQAGGAGAAVPSIGGNRNPPRPQLPSETPQTILDNILGQTQSQFAPADQHGNHGTIPAAALGGNEGAITRYMTDVASRGPDFMRSNLDAIRQHAISAFGAPALNDWMRQSISPLPGLFGSPSNHSASRDAIIRAMRGNGVDAGPSFRMGGVPLPDERLPVNSPSYGPLAR